MKASDITDLAALARIKLTEAEAAALPAELSEIMAYVGTVQALAQDVSVTPASTSRTNVLRSDVVTNQPDEYTEAALKAMPKTEGRYLQVKKIITTDRT